MIITDLLLEIARLLEICEYPDSIKAIRLKEWANALLSAGSEQKGVEILLKIKSVIAGMNSLSDIYLAPPSCAGVSNIEANRKLCSLVTDLDRQIQNVLNTHN